MDADNDAVSAFRQAIEPLVDRVCALFDSALADEREQLNRVREDYWAAYVAHGEQFAHEIICTPEDRRTAMEMASTMAKSEATTQREWLVTRIATQWATKAKPVTFSFRRLNEVIGRAGHTEAERQMRVRLRELFAERFEMSTITLKVPAAPATGLATLSGWPPLAPPQPAKAMSISSRSESGQALESVALDPAVPIKPIDAYQDLREAIKRALLMYTPDELSQQSAGVINPVGIDGETIRRIADGRTRNPHTDTRRQLRQTMVNLGYLATEK
jgi:hypothetical protein